MKFHDVGDDSASSKFAEFDQTVEPDVMARWLIEYFASRAFWTQDVKEKLFVLILPTVQEWYSKGPGVS